MLAAAVAAGLAGMGIAGAWPAAAMPRAGTGGWGTAIQLPGTAALNRGGLLHTSGVSCAAAGSCTAGGYYSDRLGKIQAFVVTEANGRWHPAIEVPGTAALNKGGNAVTSSMSCGATGSCAAGGYYSSRSAGDSSVRQAFVVSEVNGRWRPAVEVPGTAALNRGAGAVIESVSCAAAGSCAAGGFYTDGSGHGQSFVVSEVNGRWRPAIEVPGTAALNEGGNAVIDSVSCAAAGSCAAGGHYTDGSGHGQSFVVNEVNGRWRTAIEVPGTAALNKGIFTSVDSVSCAAAGSCAAGGHYTDGSGRGQAFVVSEANGRWRPAIEVPGTAALNRGGSADVGSVSCGAAGSCAAGGYYLGSTRHHQAFVVTEANGRWRPAIEVPGTAALNKRGNAVTASVSCAAAGICAAAGFYTDSTHATQAFVVNEVKGQWRTAIEVPGTAALDKGRPAQDRSVSCATARSCTTIGDYLDGSSHERAFTTSRP